MKVNILIFFILTIIFQGCAFDKKEDVEKIIGRFIMRKTYSPNNVSFEYKDFDDSSLGIVDGCKLIKLDTLNNVIYARTEFTYYVIELKDYNNTNFKLAFNKKSVEEIVFNKKLDSCKNCVTYYSCK